MKNPRRFTSKFVVYLSVFIVSVMCGITGCLLKEEQPSTINQEIGPSTLSPDEAARIRELAAEDWGVPPNSVFVGENHVGIGDIDIPLSVYQKKGNWDSALSKGNQIRRDVTCTWYEELFGCIRQQLVDQSQISVVRVYVAVSALTTHVDSAIAAWNKSGAKIYFRRVTASPWDIHVDETNEPSHNGSTSYTGYAQYSQWGNLGSYIRVRNNTGAPQDWPQRSFAAVVGTMTHELGHTIGFGHTDQTPNGDFDHISGTPTSDINSIMNSFYHSNRTFTSGDMMAARISYPLDRLQELSHLGDANGDGRTDLILIGDNGITVAIQNSSGTFNEPKLWSDEFSKWRGWTSSLPRLFGDFNGDGRLDIVGFGSGGATVALSTGSSFTSSLWIADMGSNQGWTSNHPRMVGDFNGDGYDDILGFANGGAIVRLSNGSNAFGAAGSGMWITDMGVNQGWTVASHPRMVGDFNGDGYDDILGFAHGGAIVRLSNGSNAFGAAGSGMWITDMGVNQGWSVDNNPRMVGDFNGDGYDDILGFAYGGAIVRLSNGSNAFGAAGSGMWIADMGVNQGWTVANNPRMVGDFNGDGYDDILGFSYGGTIVRISDGTSSFNGTGGGMWKTDYGVNQGWNNAALPRLIGDVNNDGSVDLVAVGYNEWILNHSTGSSFSVVLGLQYRTY